MSNETIKEFTEMIINDISQKGYDEVFINPKSYRCLRGITVAQMRELVRPYGIDLAYLTQSLVDSHCWYFYPHGAEDVTGWRQYADESI